jgi:hypothetical protein
LFSFIGAPPRAFADTSVVAPSDPGRMLNFSTRAQVGPGTAFVINGLVIDRAPKTLLVRAVGPGLAAFGLTGTLSNPTVAVYRGNQLIASNTVWSTAADPAAIRAAAGKTGAFALNNSSNDSAVLVTLDPGTYAVQVSSANNVSGTALIEIYDVDQDPAKDVTRVAGDAMIETGKRIFRYDTFGDEAFWGGQLRLHETILGANLGGTGPGLSARQALALGLKVDVDKVPPAVVEALQKGQVDLDKPDATAALLGADAVVGVRVFTQNGKVNSMGITCALCHSTVDDSFAPGIGHRLDGWPNRDLNVGAIIAFSPTVKPIADELQVSEDAVRQVLNSWGPGKFDAVLDKDGKTARPDGKPATTLIPPAFGLAGQNFHTFTGWGSVPYWNAYVGVTEMHGQGTFVDTRLNDAQKYPVAVRTGSWNVRSENDQVTSKLPALQYYQLSLAAPKPAAGSFDAAAATRGKAVFMNQGKCATCHVPPLYTEPGWALHKGSEIGIDNFTADRSPTGAYRTTPLGGLMAHAKGGFYHDGRFADLAAVVDHYKPVLGIQLTAQEETDLIEFLKSL